MPKHLYLLRHAESVVKQIGDNDKERDLTPNGIKESTMIAGFLQKNGVAFDQIISSSANRAKATTEIIVDALHADLEKTIYSDEVYEASTRTLFDLITKIEDHHNTVLLVGHNPILSYVGEYLANTNISDMATAGLAIIKFDIRSWKEVSKGNGALVNYVYPAMLLNQ